MNNLTQRDDHFFDDFFNELSPSFFVRPFHTKSASEAAKIKLEVQDKQEAYLVHAELPGVEKDQIDISIDGDSVTIKAEVKSKTQKKEDSNVLRSERYYGFMQRSFRLPVAIDTQKAEAKCENGILELKLPKLKEAQSTKLTVK